MGQEIPVRTDYSSSEVLVDHGKPPSVCHLESFYR